MTRITSSAPGRLCIVGEHQDYFGLKVLPAAIDVRLTITAQPISEPILHILLPDIHSEEQIELTEPIHYRGPRDYLRGAVTVLRRHGIPVERGFRCTVRSDIPIAKGTSSSSALTTAWILLLHHLGIPDQKLSQESLAQLSHEAEVTEFREPGGLQDHYAIACGNWIEIDCGEPVRWSPIAHRMSDLLLVDTHSKKDTTGMLNAIRNDVNTALTTIRRYIPEADLRSVPSEMVREFLGRLAKTAGNRLYATVLNRDITAQASSLLTPHRDFQASELVPLIRRHHEILRDYLGISTAEIERLIAVAYRHGAAACKINGSGGGGCFMAYAPGKVEGVRHALQAAGADAIPVSIDGPACIEETA